MKSLSFGNKILFLVNNIFALLLLVGYFSTFVSPLFLQYSALVNFGIPFLWIINGLFVLIWLLQFKKHFLLSTIVIGLGWFHFQKIFVFNNVKHQYTNGLKIMTYNVMQFYNKKEKKKNTYDDVYDFVLKERSDILCLQEYVSKRKTLFPEYRYKVINNDSSLLKTAIYSKYPIVNTKHFHFGLSNNSAVLADIAIKEDTVRVFSIHFESLNLNAIIENKRQLPKEWLFKRLGNTFRKQIEQINTLKPYMEKSPHPIIIGADMNNTALSYMYRELINLNLKDTFLESGQNYGETFKLGFLPVRIDMILIDEQLKCSEFKNYKVNYSDHFPITTKIHF